MIPIYFWTFYSYRIYADILAIKIICLFCMTDIVFLIYILPLQNNIVNNFIYKQLFYLH